MTKKRPAAIKPPHNSIQNNKSLGGLLGFNWKTSDVVVQSSSLIDVKNNDKEQFETEEDEENNKIDDK